MAKKKETTTAVAKKEDTALATPKATQKGLSDYFAAKIGVTQAEFLNTIRKTVFKGKTVPNEVMVMFLAVAREHDLNPFLKEIYAFEKDGAVSIIVPIDGWTKIINSHPQHNGVTSVDNFDDNGDLVSCTTTIYRKDRDHPTVQTEYLEECRRKTGPWDQYPIRMLRHKSLIQCARYAYGFANLIDRDESERISEADVISTSSPQATAATERNTQELKEKLSKVKGANESDAEIIDDEYPKDAVSAAKPATETEDSAPSSVGEAKDNYTEYMRGAKEEGLITEAEYIEACEEVAKKENKNLAYIKQQLEGWKIIVNEKRASNQAELNLT